MHYINSNCLKKRLQKFWTDAVCNGSKSKAKLALAQAQAQA